MKKTYTKRQITEAIAYWSKQLKMMNESLDSMSTSQIEGEATKAGKELIQYLSDEMIPRHMYVDDINNTENIDIYFEKKDFRNICQIVDAIPSAVKDQAFSCIGQDEIDKICEMKEEFEIDGLCDFTSSEREMFLSDLLKFLIVKTMFTIDENNQQIDIEYYPVYLSNFIEFDLSDDQIDRIQHLINFFEYFSSVYGKEFAKHIMNLFKKTNKTYSITIDRVNEIGEMLENNVHNAFDCAEKYGRSVIPGDPVVDEDNRDDLEEEVLDKLFAGVNNPEKNGIGITNVWNMYGDLIDCSKEEYEAFYQYVKENGY